MNVAAIIESVERDGLLLSLSESGGIEYKGPAEVVSRWLPTLKEHKPEILAALAAANDQTRTCADCQNFTRYHNCSKTAEAGLSNRFELIGAPDGYASNCKAFEAKQPTGNWKQVEDMARQLIERLAVSWICLPGEFEELMELHRQGRLPLEYIRVLIADAPHK